MKLPERIYLNTFLLWGAGQYDPANTDNIKQIDSKSGIFKNKVMPTRPTSRFLSTFSSTYHT